MPLALKPIKRSEFYTCSSEIVLHTAVFFPACSHHFPSAFYLMLVLLLFILAFSQWVFLESHSYSWMLDGSTDRFVPQSERVFISHDGTLYFSYNKKEDATSYACSLALSSTQSGHYGPFFHLRLPDKIPKLPFAPKMDSQLSQIFPEHPEIGATVYLECFAYARPSPKYRWERVDRRSLPRKSKLMNFDRVLKIDALESGDAGGYRCIAENEHGEDSSEVNLFVYAAPEIMWKLQDEMLATNETIVFDCRTAAADATIEWFRDAVLISPLLMASEDRSRFVIQHHTLTISPTRVEDSGIYQCIASNEVGSVSSSARLTVSNFKPRFDGNIMPRRIFAVSESEVAVPCVYHASPAGDVEWRRQDGERLGTEGRVRNERRGGQVMLIVERVRPSDEGDYVCLATNPHGEARFLLHLIVLDKPNVIVSPQTKHLSSHGGSVNISCEVELSCESFEECPEALFDWTLNDRPIRALPQYKEVRALVYEKYEKRERRKTSRVKQTIELELPPTLGPHRVGRFACTSLYGGGASDFEPGPLPVAPSNVKAVNISAKAVKLSWQQPTTRDRERGDSQLLVDSYRIEVRTKKEKYWKPFTDDLVFPKSGSPFLFTLENLEPNQDYQFRVKSRGGNVYSRPSRSTEWVKTLPAPPSHAVKNFRWRKLNNENLLVEWDSPESNHLSGPNLEYRLSWSSGLSSGNEREIETAAMSYVIRLNRSDADCSVLLLTVQPKNDIGGGPVSPKLIAYMSNEVPSRSATEVVATAVNSTCVKFRWKWKSRSSCDNLYGTKISCESISNATNRVVLNQSIPAEYQHWLLNGLDASTLYSCTVTPFDEHARMGKSSETVTVQTKTPAPLLPPTITSSRLQRVGDGYSTHLEWTSVPLRHDSSNNSEMAGYKIRIYISETASKPVVLRIFESQLQNKHNPSARIDGLKVMHYYQLRISGFNEGGEGPQSEPYSLRVGLPHFDLHALSSHITRSIFLPVVLLLLLFYL